MNRSCFNERAADRLGRSHNRLVAWAAISVLALALQGCANPQLVQDGQTISSLANPALVLRIAPEFRPLPPLTFPIEALTDVDRRVFVDADGHGVVRRLVILQFETVQATSAFKFVYLPKPPAAFGMQTYRFGAYVHDEEAEAAHSPLKEAGLTRAFLLAKGFKLPAVFRVARLARVANPDGKSEVIMFYMEAADADYAIRPLPGADEDGDLDLPEDHARGMLARLKAAISPVSG